MLHCGYRTVRLKPPRALCESHQANGEDQESGAATACADRHNASLLGFVRAERADSNGPDTWHTRACPHQTGSARAGRQHNPEAAGTPGKGPRWHGGDLHSNSGSSRQLSGFPGQDACGQSLGRRLWSLPSPASGQGVRRFPYHSVDTSFAHAQQSISDSGQGSKGIRQNTTIPLPETGRAATF